MYQVLQNYLCINSLFSIVDEEYIFPHA